MIFLSSVLDKGEAFINCGIDGKWIEFEEGKISQCNRKYFKFYKEFLPYYSAYNPKRLYLE